jgi:hypothetical protein
MGKTYVSAVRKNGVIAIVIVGPNKQALAAVTATSQTEWILQNKAYCSFVDTRNARWLLLFDSPAQAELFTMLALSAKLAESKTPLCISVGEGALIDPANRFKVNYSCWDLQQSKLEAPVMKEENFEISIADETPLKEIARNGVTGSVFLVKFPHNIIAIVESPLEIAPLPSISALPAESPAANPQSPPELLEAPTTQKRTKMVDQSIKPPAADTDDREKGKQKEKERDKEREKRSSDFQATVQPQPMYDSQLESIRNEMRQKFDDLSQMMASLRRTQAVQNNVALTSDILVSSVQRLLRENQIKDQLIAEKQQLIDLLNERHTDTRERDAMRIQLAELGSKLSAQRQLTKEKTEQQKSLNLEIEELQSQIVKARIDAESELAILHQQLEGEKAKQQEDLEQAKKQLQFSVQTAEEELVRIRERFEKAVSENEALKSQSRRDFSAELQKMKEAVPSIIQRTVKQMISGVFKMIQENFEEDTEYDGVAVMKAIRVALQTQANDMLEQIEGDDDEEEEG